MNSLSRKSSLHLSSKAAKSRQVDKSELKLPNDDVYVLGHSPTLLSFRNSNPNLRPLSQDETEYNQKKTLRHSIQVIPSSTLSGNTKMLPASIESSAASTRQKHHSLGSIRDLKSKFRLKKSKRVHSSETSSNELTRASSRISTASALTGTNTKLSKISTTASSSSYNIKQNFWKYHIMEIGNDYYLTTNPDPKHVYCRNAPGYHVQVLYPTVAEGKVDRTGLNGFRLIFRDEDVDGEICTTVTAQTKSEGGNFVIDATQKTFENSERIITWDPVEGAGFNQEAKETDIKEMKGNKIESSVKFCRYETFDAENTKWYIGSIPQFKSHSKLRNKRFIYFHNPANDKILACFRPHESRTKKKIIKKLNSSLNSSSFEHYGDEERENDVIADANEIFYSPGDGVFQIDPPDDSPSDVKLGWITIFDDYDSLKQKGIWEMALSLTLAIGFSKVLEAKRESLKY